MNALLLSVALAVTVQVGSKNFAESHLLGELFAQAIEARGVAVQRHLGLGGSEVAFRALEAGALDVYPEYDGTALLVLLGEAPDARPIGLKVAQSMARRGLAWLSPLGFSNDWVLALPQAKAQAAGLERLSDLARVPGLRGGFSAEFLGRADGLAGLERAYGFRLDSARPLAESLKYQALAQGTIDLIDAYSTDPSLDSLGLRGLTDDRQFFPSYACAPLSRADLAVRAPEAQAALLSLAGRLDLATMRRLNGLVQQGVAEADVAREFLQSIGLQRAEVDANRGTTRKSLGVFLAGQWPYLVRLLVRHLELTFTALASATLLGLLLGTLASRRPLAETLILKSVGLAQTIPSLPLLAFLVPWLGIGVWPSIVALFLYALLPIVQAIHAALTSVDPDLVWVAVGQGMTERQVARWVRFPLATGVALAGVRVAAVTTVGNATLAAFVGGGGLGEPILAGLALNDNRLILLGAIPAAMLAVTIDAALAWLSRRLAPTR